MPARDFFELRYIPLLSLRPAEMLALESLPEGDKELLLPSFQLRPWMGAHRLESALARIAAAYGSRPCFLDIAEAEPLEGARRQVHDELDALRVSAGGFDAWCTFVEAHPQFIPALQLSDVREFDAQAERLHSLGRGVLVQLDREAFRFARQIASRTAAATRGGIDVVYLLDYGRQTRDLLLQQAEAVALLRSVREQLPEAFLSFSASSFPDNFTSVSQQPIYERQFFDEISSILADDRLIYSDRGSARAERQLGGGGAPAPRIDYPQLAEWRFFRAADSRDRPAAYQRQARLLMTSSGIWDGDLRVWGTQMIERTALGDEAAITSPARATAVRINLHLHRQLFHDDPDGLYDTDEDWTD